MGTFLLIVGFFWAGSGILNMYLGMSNIAARGGSDLMGGVNLVISVVFFIIPGLALAGVGSYIRGKRKAPKAG